MIRAGRLTNVMPYSDFESWREQQDRRKKQEIFFSLFIVPDAGSGIEAGDVVIAKDAKLPHNEAAIVPLVVGDWSPVVFLDIDPSLIAAGGVSLDESLLYVAPMDGRDVVVK